MLAMQLTHYLTKAELDSLDLDYLRDKIPIRQGLNYLLGRKTNQALLAEVELLLEGRAIPRKPSKNGKVTIIIKGDGYQ